MSQASTKGYAKLIAPPLDLQTKRQLLGSVTFVTFILNIIMAISTFLGFTISTSFEYSLSLSVLESFLWVAWLAVCFGIEESAFFFFTFAFAIINIIFEIIQFAWRVYLIAGESIFDFPITFQYLVSFGIIIGNFVVIFVNVIIFVYLMQIKEMIIDYYEEVMEAVNKMIERGKNQNIRNIIEEEEEEEEDERRAPIPTAPPMTNQDYFQSSQQDIRRRKK